MKVRKTSMGAWGYTLLENDSSLDALGEICDFLVSRMESACGREDGSELFLLLEVYFNLPRTSPDAQEIFDNYVPLLLKFDQGWRKQKYREKCVARHIKKWEVKLHKKP